MKKDEFLVAFCELLQRDESVSESTRLFDLEEWDSLAYLNLMSFFAEHFGIRIEPNTLKECQNVADIINLANGKINA
ncbi:acyl carrier protein [Campylobacter sp. 19-13652]|uniref:acyl carrier protein n=1 Tax=Campylobacter sp. 19-13652 TaxID=2840180 RepID=UPI001C7404C1|nr:acyl carrier protein [Campylobacter sp. 19-13652]BCX80184.1 acyl carrier protein [Campylobacter sp. 19-13652]